MIMSRGVWEVMGKNELGVTPLGNSKRTTERNEADDSEGAAVRFSFSVR